MKTKLIEKAELYAVARHNYKNCFYSKFPYSYHLQEVVNAALHSESLFSLTEREQELVLAACWAHDVIEDTGETYNDVVSILGQDVADIVYDVTNEVGKTRKERALKTYPKIAKNKLARFVKLCDRIANMEHSWSEKSSLLDKYIREFEEFEKQLRFENEFTDLWTRLESIISLYNTYKKEKRDMAFYGEG